MTRSHTSMPGTYRSPLYADGTIDHVFLRQLRRTAGLTQEQLAQILRMQRMTYNRWEKGTVTHIAIQAHRAALIDWALHVQRRYGSPEEGQALPGMTRVIHYIDEEGTRQTYDAVVLCLVRGKPFTDLELAFLARNMGVSVRQQAREIGVHPFTYKNWRLGHHRPQSRHQRELAHFIHRYTNEDNQPLAPVVVRAIREGRGS